MALTFNLAAVPLKYVAFPIVAGLAAGTGALAAYVTTGPASAPKQPVEIVAALPATPGAAMPAVTSEQITPAKANKKPPSCEEQTWPYIDNRCIARKGDKGEPARNVRLVMASRDGDGGLATGTGPKLVTSDGVLRGPNMAPEAPKVKPVTPAAKKSVRRTEVRQPRQSRDEFRRVYSVYSVPSADSTKPVIVVRPLGVNQYASEYSTRF
jgi:hypothetical protein